jgi:[ribosomal protein S18]-alanine N-acetyltransferase
VTPDELAALHHQGITVPRPWSAAEIAGLLSGTGVFLCTVPQGFAMGRAVADEVELLTLVVAPEARRLGLGRQLLAAFETEAQARGAARSFLEVAADNAPAIALYTRAGYAQTGRRRGYYHAASGPAIDALLMMRDF